MSITIWDLKIKFESIMSALKIDVTVSNNRKEGCIYVRNQYEFSRTA